MFKHTRLVLATALTVGAATFLMPSASPNAAEQSGQTASKKQQVVDLLKSIETGAPGPVAVINPNKYIQHNLAAADGLAGFGELMKQLPKGSAKVSTKRVLQDGNYVITHTDYDFFGPKIGFDIFRFEGDRIVEHWDNLQTTAPPNPGGHTMIDGPTEIADRSATEANKKLVRNFVEDFLVNRRVEKIDQYFNGTAYIQHNPRLPDGNALFRTLPYQASPPS